MKEFYMPVINVIHSPDHSRILTMAQVIDIKRMADLFDAVLHIQAGRAIRISLISDRQPDLIRDVLDETRRIVVDGRIHCAASGMPQYDHEIRSQMFHRILDAAKLVVIDYIAGKPDCEQLTDSCTEDALRYHSRI